MQVFRSLEEVPAELGPTVVSVGNFDGVHRAHQEVVQRMADRAHSLEGKAMVVTFEPHPYRILRRDHLPLYRQSAILERETNVSISRATMDGWVMTVGGLLMPIAVEMGRELVGGGYIQ